MAYTRPISASLLQTGLAGTLGYTVTDPAGTVLVARTTAGVVEAGTSAIYTAAVAGWDESWSGRIAWDAGAGTLAVEDFLPTTGSGGGGGGSLDAYERAALLGNVAKASDGSLTFFDADDPSVKRFRRDPVAAPGGRAVVFDPE